MRISWNNLKGFLDDTELFHFLNYIDLTDNFFVWLSYQNENFSTILSKGSIDCEDFENNYKSKAILKNDIASDGYKYQKVTHVKEGRTLSKIYTLITTSTKTHNDKTGYINVLLFDSEGNETEDSNLAVKTVLDFEPPFDYEIYGGGLEVFNDLQNEFYFSVILVPDIPVGQGGSKVIIINRVVKGSKTEIEIAPLGATELLYNENLHTNKVRISIEHDAGIQQEFQTEVHYYS